MTVAEFNKKWDKDFDLYVNLWPSGKDIDLDGTFTLDELKAVVAEWEALNINQQEGKQ